MSTRPTVAVKTLSASSAASQDDAEFAAGAVPYAWMPHPSQPYVYASVNSGVYCMNITTRTAIADEGAIASAVGLIGNAALIGIAFDSTGRYMYATSGATSLYTFDFGAAFVNIADPTLASTVTISAGGNLHVLNVIGSNLYILSDSANNFQVLTLAAPALPVVSSTTAATTVALGCTMGFVTRDGGLKISYPAGTTAGSIGTVTVASPATQEILTMPTVGGRQLEPLALYFVGSGKFMYVLTRESNGGTPALYNYFWTVWDISGGFAGMAAGVTTAVCVTENVSPTNTLDEIRGFSIASSPYTALGLGGVAGVAPTVENSADQYDMGVCVQSEVPGEQCEVRWYRANWDKTLALARLPKLSAAFRVDYTVNTNSGAYYLRSLPDAVGWTVVGVSTDRANPIILTVGVGLYSYRDKHSFVDLTAYVCQEPGIQVSFGVSGADPTSRVASTGTMTFECDNSQFNATSALAGLTPDVATVSAAPYPGKQVRLEVGSGPTYMFRGTIDKVDVVPGKYRERRIRVSCVDVMDALAQVRTDRLSVQIDSTLDTVVAQLLDAAPLYPGTENTLNMFSDVDLVPGGTFPYSFDRSYDEKTVIMGELQKIVNSARGIFFMDPTTNTVLLRTKNELRNGALTQIFSESSMTGMVPEYERGNVYNDISAKVYPRSVDSAATTVLFTLKDRPLIKPGQTLVIEAQYRDPAVLTGRIGGVAMVYPVVTTDYTFFTKKNSGGTNLSTSLSVQATFGGTGARLAIYNNDTRAGYLRFLQLRGKGVYSQEPVVYSRNVPASIMAFQQRDLTYDMPYETDPTVAKDTVDALVAVYENPRFFIKSISFFANESDTLYGLLTYRPGDKIAVTETMIGFTNTNVWALGTSTLGTSTYLFPYDVYYLQRINFKISNNKIVDAKFDLVPSELNF